MNKKVLMVVLGFFVISVSVFFISKGKVSQENMEAEVTIREPETVVQEEVVMLVAKLEDVSGGDSSGTAIIIRENVLKHEVEASLPELVGDTFYEGWLVKQKPSLKFFSTGVIRLPAEKLRHFIEGAYFLPSRATQEEIDMKISCLSKSRVIITQGDAVVSLNVIDALRVSPGEIGEFERTFLSESTEDDKEQLKLIFCGWKTTFEDNSYLDPYSWSRYIFTFEKLVFQEDSRNQLDQTKPLP
jgi:hypothetical protein